MPEISIINIHTFLDSECKNLTNEETTFLNSIFKDVDKEDKEGNLIGNDSGDGFLNNNEWANFKNMLKIKAKDLYNKLTSYIRQTNENIEYDYFSAPKVFDMDMYSDEALRKAFPEDKYEIVDSLESMVACTIKDKDTGKEVLKIAYTEDITIDIDNRRYRYDPGNRNLYLMQDNNTNVVYQYDDGKIVSKRDGNIKYKYDGDGGYTATDLTTGERIYYDANNKELKRDTDSKILSKAIVNCFTVPRDPQAIHDLLNKVCESSALEILGKHYYLLEYLNDTEGISNPITPQKLFESAKKQVKQKGIDIDDTREYSEQDFKNFYALYKQAE